MCVWAGRGGGGDLSNWCFKVPRDPLVGLVSPTPLTHTLLPTPLCRTTRPERALAYSEPRTDDLH